MIATAACRRRSGCKRWRRMKTHTSVVVNTASCCCYKFISQSFAVAVCASMCLLSLPSVCCHIFHATVGNAPSAYEHCVWSYFLLISLCFVIEEEVLIFPLLISFMHSAWANRVNGGVGASEIAMQCVCCWWKSNFVFACVVTRHILMFCFRVH